MATKPKKRRKRQVKPGHPNGPPPFGYCSVVSQAEARRLKIPMPPLEVDPLEQRIIRYAIRGRDAGWTYEKIADGLNKLGYTTRSGGPWPLQGVARILKGKEDRK